MKNYTRREGGINSNQAVTFAGLEGELLLAHGLGVELRERVSRAAESVVNISIGLIEMCGNRFPLLRHLNCSWLEILVKTNRSIWCLIQLICCWSGKTFNGLWNRFGFIGLWRTVCGGALEEEKMCATCHARWLLVHAQKWGQVSFRVDSR